MLYEVSPSSDRRRSNRYRKCSIHKDVETGESLLSTREIKPISKTNRDQVHKVKTNETTRLDLIAYQYYNNALLWWVVAEANDITDPFEEIPAGTYLRIPSVETLYANGGILA